MSRTLAFVAVIGLVLSVAFFALAFLIAGDQIFQDNKPLAAIRPLIDLANRKQWRWDGGDTLAVDAPVVLHYEQGGAPGVTVTGPAGLLAQVRVGGGQIVTEKQQSHRGGEKLDVVVSGVKLRKFQIRGGQDLRLGHIDQDNLDVRVYAGGAVSADGKVGRLNLVIAGDGSAEFGRLIAGRVKVAILGPGNAVLAPQDALYLTMAGPGLVRLRSHPTSIQKTILGPGQLIEEGDASAERAAPPLPPTPPEQPVSGAHADYLVEGSHSQDLGHLNGGDVQLTITGSGSAKASGQADRLSVLLSGSGDARLGNVAARQVSVTITGSGDATIAPRATAQVTILGSGNVYLLTRPAKIERNIMGSGRIIEKN